MMPWNYFSSLKIAFLEETPFGPFASFAQLKGTKPSEITVFPDEVGAVSVFRIAVATN